MALHLDDYQVKPVIIASLDWGCIQIHADAKNHHRRYHRDMLNKNPLLDSIQTSLSETLGKNFELQWLKNLSGGDINQAALIGDKNTRWFLKYHFDASIDMFETEAQALTEMSSLACIRVPQPVALGQSEDCCWLLLEYLDLSPSGPESLLGEHLAAMHSTDFDHYGWHRSNFIGTTPQSNSVAHNWMIFWRDQRILPQLEMAGSRGFGGKLQDSGEELLTSMELFLNGHQPVASLLHGDLWAGNKAYSRSGLPVIFDPASYYGDLETDIAMTELFGGFGADFYAAYNAHSAMDDGYPLRRDLYNLYHVLNHLNLFGQSYLGRAENMISSLLARVR